MPLFKGLLSDFFPGNKNSHSSTIGGNYAARLCIMQTACILVGQAHIALRESYLACAPSTACTAVLGHQWHLLTCVPSNCAPAGVDLPHVDYDNLRAALVSNCIK